LKRALQQYLVDPLAMKLLSGEFKAGEHIKATAQDGELIFAKK